MISKNILLVEDQGITAMDLQVRLERMGYSVVDTVDTGEEAIIQALEQSIDLILMDIKLNSDMTGIDAACEINAVKDIPIIYLTASTDEATLQETLKTEPYGFIHKPFNEYDLRYSIETALYKHDHDKKQKELNLLLQQKNSELNAANEELQSTLEELEASNEELQATMEEVQSTHEELCQTQDELTAMEERYHQLFINMSSGAAVYHSEDNGQNFILLDINKSGERILNIRKKNVINANIVRFLIDNNQFSIVDSITRVFQTGKPERLPAVHMEGSRIKCWLEYYIYRLPDRNIIAIFDDHTKQKQAEMYLIESEHRYRSLFENAPVGIAMVSADGRMVMTNSALENILGYSGDELLSMSISSITNKEDFSKDASLFREVRDGNRDSYILEKRYRKKNGDEIWGSLYLSGVRDQSGNLAYAVAMVQDISDLKRAEDELRLRNEETTRLNEELEAANEELVAVNEEMEASNEELIRTNEDLLETQKELGIRVKELRCLFSISDLSHKEGISINEIFQGAVDSIPGSLRFPERACAYIKYGSTTFKSCDYRKTRWRYDITTDDFDNTSLTLSVYYRKKPPITGDSIFTDDEKELLREIAIRLSNVARSIRVEEDLKKSEQRYAMAQRATGIGNWEISVIDKSIYLSEELAVMAGLGKGTFTGTFNELMVVIHPDDLVFFKKRISEALKNRGGNDMEFRIVRPDGETRWVHGTGDTVFDDSGSVEKIVGLALDITERKNAEEKVRENENFLTEIFHSIRDGISVLDKNLRILRVNKTMEEMYSHRMPLVGSFCYNSYQERKDMCPWCPSIRALHTGEREEEIVPYPSSDNPTGWIQLTSHPLTDRSGNSIGIIEIVKDITDKMIFEQTLLESENRFRRLFEGSRDGIVIVEPDGTIVNCNESYEKLIGYTLDELYDKRFFDLTPEKWHEFEQTEVLKKQIFTRGYSETCEREYIHKNGTIFPVELNAYILEEKDGEPKLLWAMVRDISERKDYEERLKASIQEKEVLLKEVHHRVKNNMQVISSLLFLQSGYVENRSDRGLFIDCQNRVNSMAAVHEMLYKSEDFARINLKSLILELVDTIRNSLYIHPETVVTEVKGKELYYGIDRAIPCAQIVNELLSNSFKHAFKHGIKGMIVIELKKIGNDEYILDYRDNGIGLPDGFNLENSTSLGLKLINELVKGLKGSVRVEIKNGTRYIISLPKPQKTDKN